MLNIIILIFLIGGVTSVAIAQHQVEEADHLERIGGLLLVAGLIGLGFILKNQL